MSAQRQYQSGQQQQRQSGGQTMYHYTSKEAAKGIWESGKIRASTDTQHDAMAGRGTYFTPMNPKRKFSAILLEINILRTKTLTSLKLP